MFRELITCSKTKTLSSMRLINLVGSFVLLFCIVWVVVTDMEVAKLSCLVIGLGAINGAKTIQSRYESKE